MAISSSSSSTITITVATFDPPTPPFHRHHNHLKLLSLCSPASPFPSLRRLTASLATTKHYKRSEGAEQNSKLSVSREEHSSMQREGVKKMHRTWTPGRKTSLSRQLADSEADVKNAPHESVGIVRDYAEESTRDSAAEMAEDDDLATISSSELNCRHFGRCSGCTMERQLHKPQVLEDVTKFFKARGVHDFDFVSKHVRGWRCRAKLAVRGTSHSPSIGLFEAESHEVLDIPACQAHHPSINIAVELLKQAIRELSVEPYDDLTHSGQLRYVQMIATMYNTSIPLKERYTNAKVQISLVWNSRDENSPNASLLHELAKFLWRKGGNKSDQHLLHSIWCNFQTSKGNVIFGGRWRHLFGEAELWEHLGGVDVCFMPSSFGQANIWAFQALLRSLQKFVPKGAAVVDLYAGVGVIGLSLAVTRSCRVVTCVEVNKGSRNPFELSLSRLSKDLKTDFSWYCADVSATPIKWLQGVDIVIVDPPRKGLEASIIEALRLASKQSQGKVKGPSSSTMKLEKRPWILRMMGESVREKGALDWNDHDAWPTKLIYVSCGWHSFQEDCLALEKDDLWYLDYAQAFNFFPGTDSIEILAVFKVGKKPKRGAKQSTPKRKLRREAPSRYSSMASELPHSNVNG